jgi:diguanylate cyclase (GGDEF)-like protein/PAS domain S-box-containing protein
MEADPDRLEEVLTLLGHVATIAGECHYIRDRRDGAFSTRFASPGLARLVGLPDGAEASYWDRVHPDDLEAVERMDAAITAGGRYGAEYRLVGFDGVTRWVRDRGVAVRLDDGRTRLFGFAVDASTEVHYRETIDRMGEALREYYFTDELLVDGSYRTVFATAAQSRLLGELPKGMTPVDAWHAAVHPEDRQHIARIDARLRAGNDAEVEYRLVGYDGLTRWVSVRFHVVETRADGTVVVDGVAQDVTDRRATEDRLTEITSVIDEVLYTDEYLPDGSMRDVFLTPNWRRLVGAEGMSAAVVWENRVHPDDKPIAEAIDDAFRRGDEVDGEYRLVGVDGVTRWIRDRARPHLREDGVVVVNGILSDVTSEREAREALAAARDEADRLSRVDTLTQTFNRRHFTEALVKELDRGGRLRLATGLLAVDIDHFKLLNDLRGHPVGDEVLREVADRLGAAIRGYDTLARWGGEEFVVLVPSIGGREELLAAGERIRLAIEGSPIRLGGEQVPVTVSVGGAWAGPVATTADDLLERADRALYAAKSAGRNRTVLEDDTDVASIVVEPVPVRLARAFAIAAGAREGMPPNHLEDVAELSALVGLELHLSSLEAVRCRLAGWLHDVGKVAVPDRILMKPGPLDDEEWVVMREHVIIGERLVRQVPELADAARAVRHHHERFDGSGYPDALTGEAIPLGARIVAVVDAYSAMTSPRVYSSARSADAAVAEIRRCAGSHFDPAVVEAFVRVLERSGIVQSSA